MKIIIDSTEWQRQQTGMTKYAEFLVNKLIELYPENDYTIILNAQFTYTDEFLEKLNIYHTRIRHIGWKREMGYGLCVKNILANYDIYHCLTEKWPTFMKGGICTIHDLRHTRKNMFAGFCGLKNICFAHMIRTAVKNTDEIITISNNTKSELLSYVGQKWAPKIHVVHHGTPDDLPNGVIDDTIVENKYNIKSRYFITVGEIKRHKNVLGLVKAFDVYKRKYDRECIKLLVVGKIVEDVIVKKSHIINKDDVIFTDYVELENLNALYKNAVAMVMVSMIEGFGFPVVEAMARGIPVICSDTTSLVEISDGAALTANPFNSEEIAYKMHRLATNDGLRKDMIRRGTKVANKYSWTNTAIKTMRLYQKIYDKRQRKRQRKKRVFSAESLG